MDRKRRPRTDRAIRVIRLSATERTSAQPRWSGKSWLAKISRWYLKYRYKMALNTIPRLQPVPPLNSTFCLIKYRATNQNFPLHRGRAEVRSAADSLTTLNLSHETCDARRCGSSQVILYGWWEDNTEKTGLSLTEGIQRNLVRVTT